MEANERFIVLEIIKFGMLFGYTIWDRVEKEVLPYEFNEDEYQKAKSKCDFKNVLNN
jgi:hypothetical protein